MRQLAVNFRGVNIRVMTDMYDDRWAWSINTPRTRSPTYLGTYDTHDTCGPRLPHVRVIPMIIL